MWKTFVTKIKVWLGLAAQAQDVIDDVQEKADKIFVAAEDKVDEFQERVDAAVDKALAAVNAASEAMDDTEGDK